MALAGSLLGFLYWNRNRARLFMGDCGSLFIGAVLAAASIVPVFNTRLAFISPSVIVTLVLVVPLFDTGFVLVLRRLAGRKASKGGTDHVSHRLVSLGFSERSAVRILYLLGLIGGGTAWVLTAYSALNRCCRWWRLRLIGPWSASISRGYRRTTRKISSRSKIVIRTVLKTSRSGGTPARSCSTSCASRFATTWRTGSVRGQDLDNFLPYSPLAADRARVQAVSLYASRLYQRSWERLAEDVAAVVRGVGGVGLVDSLDGVCLPAPGVLACRVHARCNPADDRNRRHTRVIPLDEPRRLDAQQDARRVLVYGGRVRASAVREMRSNTH